jgi:hypothetical protein
MQEARDAYTWKLAMAHEARKSPFIRELCAFLSAIEDDEAVIYDAASWRAMGEKYGNETSVVWTIISDGGPLYFALRPGYAVGADGIAEANRIEGIFRKFLERHGLWYKLGYSWTVHLIDDAAWRAEP